MIPPARNANAPGPTRRARRGLAYLEQELLSLERGEEPDLGRLVGICRAVRVALLRARAARAAMLCASLRRFLEEIREDAAELSLEDVDTTLSAVARMRLLLEDENAVDDWMDGVTPAGIASPSTIVDELCYAPEFRESGLYWELRDESVHVGLPALEPASDAGAVIEDLERLWSRFPAAKPLTLRVGRLERVPVALLSAVIRLHRSEGARARRVQLQGGSGELQSPALGDSLGRCFAAASA